MVELVFIQTSPSDEAKPSAGPKRPPDIGERGDRIGEKHHAEARKGGVERTGRKWIRLGVAKQEGDVFRQAWIEARHLNGGLKHIHPDHPAARPNAAGEHAWRTSNPTANVKHPLAGLGPNRCDRRLTQRTELAFEGLADFKP